jgi:hypothetical protein
VFSNQTNYRALHYHSEGVVYCCSDFQPRARNLVASASVRRRSKLTYKVFGGCKLLLFADEKGVPKRQVNILLAIVGRSYTVLCRTIWLSEKCEIYESRIQNCISYGLNLIISATKDVCIFSDPTSQGCYFFSKILGTISKF